LKEANANYAAKMRSDLVSGKIEAAENQAAKANSGQNLENALRQRIDDIVKSPKLRRGFNREEIAAMQQYVRGERSANVLRFIGNLLGGGGGLGALVTGGASFMAGGPAAAVAVPAAGYAIKRVGNALSASRARALDEMIRSRAPAAAAANAARVAAQAARQQRQLQVARMGVLPAPIFGSLAPGGPPALTTTQASTPFDQNDPRTRQADRGHVQGAGLLSRAAFERQPRSAQ